MQTDQLSGLIALKAVADQKSFTEGAELLGVSASAVSQSIKQLERRLGVTLLARTTRSITLTEAGLRFLSQAGPALEQILAAMANIGSYAERPSGLLRLNMPRTAYPGFLEPIVSSFIKKYPEVAVESYFDDDLSDVVGQGFDAGIRLSETMAKDMVAIKLLGPIRFVVAGSPKYFDKMGRPKHPKDLHAHNCIRMRFSATEIYERWEFEEKGKEFQVEVTGSLIFNDSLFAMNAALAGMGVTYCVEQLVQDRIKSGKLEIVLGQYGIRSGGFYLYYPERAQALPKLKAFIEHIRSPK